MCGISFIFVSLINERDMILNERDSRHEHVLNVARQMMTAARTAPKGKGIDIIETAIVTGEETLGYVESHVRRVWYEILFAGCR